MDIADNRQVDIRNIGSQVAEDEVDSLKGYYLDNKYFREASQFSFRLGDQISKFGRDHKHIFFIGRTGSGKSAILEMIRQNKRDADRILSINKDDIATSLLLHNPDILSTPQHLQHLLFKSLWKYVLLTNIMKLIYGNKPEAILQIYSSDDRSVQNMLDKFSEKVNEQKTMAEQVLAFISVAKEVKTIGESDLSESEASGRVHKIFKLLFDFEIQKLPSHTSGKRLFILIDDLDSKWSGSSKDTQLVKTLLECIIELTRKLYENLKFVVVLRSDIFSQIEFHQREKIREYVREIRWSPSDLQKLIDLRIKTCWNMEGRPTSEVWAKFPKEIPTSPKATQTFKYILARALWRPRDIINFVNLCVDESRRRSLDHVSIDTIRSAEVIYSRQRAEALYDEWKYALPDIGRWMDLFAGAQRSFRPGELESKGLAKAIVDKLFMIGFLGFYDGRSVKFSFSSSHESPIPGNDVVINATFDQFLLARAEELGKSIESGARVPELEIEEAFEDASIASSQEPDTKTAIAGKSTGTYEEAGATERAASPTSDAETGNHLAVQKEHGDAQLNTPSANAPFRQRALWMPGEHGNYASLASYVDRNNADLDVILAGARKALGMGLHEILTISHATGVREVATAIYHSILYNTELTYEGPPANPGEPQQEVRLAGQVLKDLIGTCLDLSLFYASILERGSLAPALLFIDGQKQGDWHSLGGFFDNDSQHSIKPVLSDKSLINTLVENGSLIAIETTGLSKISGRKKTFEQACKAASASLEKAKTIVLVNIVALRRAGFHPPT